MHRVLTYKCVTGTGVSRAPGPPEADCAIVGFPAKVRRNVETLFVRRVRGTLRGGKKSDFTRHLLYGCVCAPAIPENLLESRRRGYGRDVAAVGLPENRNRPDVRAEGPAGRKRNARPTIVVPPSRQQ